MLGKPVKEILTQKVVSVPRDTLLSEVVSIMNVRKISCLLIAEDKKAIGIFTERDLVRSLVNGDLAKDLRIGQLMTRRLVTVPVDITVYEAYNTICENRIRHLVVLDAAGDIAGIITHTDFVNNLSIEYFVQFKKLSEIMTRNVITLQKHKTVGDTLARMAEHSISCIVVEENGLPIGIVTERDMITLSFKEQDISSLKIEAVMSSPVVTISLDRPVYDSYNLMQGHKIRRLVVTDQSGRIAGLITQYDIVSGLEHKYIQALKRVIAEKEVRLSETIKSLQESQRSYQALAENLPGIVYRLFLNVNTPCRMQFFNSASQRITGYAHDELKQGKLCLIEQIMLEEDAVSVRETIENAIAGKRFFEVEYRIRHKNGDIRHLLEQGRITCDENGSPIWIDGLISDITERKTAEDRISVALKEKETLLRELYHRTKNNMQVITSLINLQSMTIDDKKTLQILDDTKNRIQSIALVHEKLYKAKNLSQVFLGDYIKDLTAALVQGYHANKEQIHIHVDVENIKLYIDTITPLGLVINELITNSLKYAFPGNRKGDITIKSDLNEDGMIELSFTDNGIGMPSNIDFTKTESLGLKIVRTLVASQIKGKLEMRTQNGTTFIIRFKENDIPERI